MNQSSTKNRRTNRSFGTRSKLSGIAILALLAAYSFAAPRLNDSFGWNLPQLGSDSGGDVPLVDPSQDGSSEESKQDLRYGLLREVSHDRYLSPAGLLYTPGSAEGHRLEHLRRHTKDDPNRAGSHGVFDGEMEGALETIDRAYEKARKGQQTTRKVDQRRTIYTVDMGGRIGFVGGREGDRKRNPMARRVRLVLEGNRVITAYPL